MHAYEQFTQEAAVKLNIRGWVKNTDEGTVIGVAEGSDKAMVAFKAWLQTKG